MSYMIPEINDEPDAKAEDGNNKDEDNNLETDESLNPMISKNMEKLCYMIKSEDYYATDLESFVNIFQMGAMSACTVDTHNVRNGIINLIQNPCLQYLIKRNSVPLSNLK
ncbi:hypothetical protein C0995_004781, partial [Termitomyces sp. Mi166